MVCATDAGREGELIFRYIYEAAGCTKPVSRLWISSLTPDAIRRGSTQLRPGQDFDPLADAARGRSRADWLVGMNLSRAYTLAYDEEISRWAACRRRRWRCWWSASSRSGDFVPENYLEVVATFTRSGGPKERTYQGTWFRGRAAQGDRNRFTGPCGCRPTARKPSGSWRRARTGQAAMESIAAEDAADAAAACSTI